MTDENETGRRLRVKERKVYLDQDLDDDEIDGKRNFSVEEKLNSNKYTAKFVKTIKGEDYNLKYVQENGFTTPLLVEEKSGLGMRMPSQNFKVSDVKQCVGSRRMIDVMDVTTQKAMEMSMKEWVRYFENPERDRLLNVISLEFSHTRLENYVTQPALVRQMDWVDCVWPRHLKECQTESTNIIEKMKYPKVQKYCLMSVKGCYTDFHIDFGGTSVWYHILHGSKIFWLIPPTEKNLEMYEHWVLSGKQGDVFFADQVEKCQRVELLPGSTFFIPTGWIHAVFTPKDSLVFGGNFIHSFNIPMQLRIREVEDKTHVPNKFRYPFYGEMLWYVLERYVSCVMNKTHRVKSKEEIEEEKESKSAVKFSTVSPDMDEKSNDSCASGESKESTPSSFKENDPSDFSAPQSPVGEDHSFVSNPKSSKAVRAIKSEHCESSPGSPVQGSSSPKTETPGSKTSTRPVRGSRAQQSDTPVSSTVKSKGSLKISTHGDYMEKINQMDLIKPLSVKLQDCMKQENTSKPWQHLTPYELEGLRFLIDYIETLTATKKCIPKDIPDPDGLLKDIKKLLTDHANDDPKLAVTGEMLLKWPPLSLKKQKMRMKSTTSLFHTPKVKGQKGDAKMKSSVSRRRRTRCKRCEPCTRTDCGECNFCKDMRKFGGPGRMKQSCVSRQCLRPILPHTATCMLCGEDERIKSEDGEDETTTLLECGICWEIVHPTCLSKKNEGLTSDGIINEDLPNSWECPKCCDDGKQGQIKPRVLKGGLRRPEDMMTSATSSNEDSPELKVSNENDPDSVNRISPRKRPATSPAEKSPKKKVKAEVEEASPTKPAQKPRGTCSSGLRSLSSPRMTTRGREVVIPSRYIR